MNFLPSEQERSQLRVSFYSQHWSELSPFVESCADVDPCHASPPVWLYFCPFRSAWQNLSFLSFTWSLCWTFRYTRGRSLALHLLKLSQSQYSVLCAANNGSQSSKQMRVLARDVIALWHAPWDSARIQHIKLTVQGHWSIRGGIRRSNWAYQGISRVVLVRKNHSIDILCCVVHL